MVTSLTCGMVSGWSRRPITSSRLLSTTASSARETTWFTSSSRPAAFGDRGVKFAYWYDHGTISAPMPTTYDQLHRWIMAGDFSQAFYINDDSLETPEKLDEEAAAEARMDDLLNAPAGANCDYCGTWCAHGEYDEDWMGTGLSVCYAGEHEAEKAESEAHFYCMSPVSPRHWIWSSEDSKHDDE